MHLIDFRGSGGDDFGLLDKAKDSCLKILACQPHSDTLDAHFMAGSIAIATSYAKHVQVLCLESARWKLFLAFGNHLNDHRSENTSRSRDFALFMFFGFMFFG